MATKRAKRAVKKGKKAKSAKAKARPKAKAKLAPQVAVTPYLCCKGAAAALDFYKAGFGAKERLRMTAPDGSVGHAEILISGMPIMISDEWADGGVFSPTTVGGTPVMIHVYVRDVDGVVAEAVSSGATLLRPVEDMPYGDRTGTIRDPFGHRWMIATHKERVPKAQLRKRFGEAFTIS
ncbi:MAG: VOC family protein [Myxococcota bacterium]